MRMLLILAGLAVSLAAASQEIYRWVDKDGIVHYADQPGAANAELINVIAPSTYEAPDSASYSSSGADDTGGGRSEPTASPYTSLSITSPSPDQVYFGADAVVLASVELGGTLQPDHTIAFFLNGDRQPGEGGSTEFSGLARGSYSLRAAVLDQDGNPVIQSRPVSFHVRQPSKLSPQSPQAPPKPPPKPAPKPATPPRM
jgi:hypothetical protein